MRRRHPLPKIWLMTDRRLGDLRLIVARLPRRSGIVFRHYDELRRRSLFKTVLRASRRGNHVVVLAGEPDSARAWGADGAHSRSAKPSRGIRTMAVHNAREAALARRMKADLIFVSPVFATRSHADAQPLSRVRFGSIALGQNAIALGGMDACKFRKLSALKPYGWAGIDAFRT